MNGWRQRVVLWAAVVGVVDLASKLAAERELVGGVELAAGARLVLGHNTGVAFGGFAGAPPAALVALSLLCLAGLLFALARGLLAGGPVAAGLILGGAVSNLVDRVQGGGVTDFIDIGAWPSFNLADAALTLGMAMVLWRSVREPGAPQVRGAASRPG